MRRRRPNTHQRIRLVLRDREQLIYQLRALCAKDENLAPVIAVRIRQLELSTAQASRLLGR